MGDTEKNDNIDLGSDPVDDFDPFANDDDFADDATNDIAGTAADESSDDTAEENTEDDTDDTDENTSAPPQPKPETKKTAPKQSETDSDDDSDNPMTTAIAAAETKDAEKARQSVYQKPPVFEYAGAAENIEDSAQTFDELRIAKAADFPELEEGKRVSWTVEYGKITKSVTDAKGTSVAKMKSDIESSKEFLDALKKAKDKNPVCKVKPRVTAQSKGGAAGAVSGYKGVFTCLDEADAAGKVISVLPAKDGKVYEIRDHPLGRFITPVVGCELLSDVRAGFIPASGIPLIPMALVMRIIAFFRGLTDQRQEDTGASSAFSPKAKIIRGTDNEALVNIYWDRQTKAFVADTPEQMVSGVSVDSNENPDYLNERYLHYMDIHSHNRMRAFFSPVDDNDEKATRLYTVIGRLDQYMPEIKTRISNGGKFHEIDPGEVFEYIGRPFPEEWLEKVRFGAPHKDECNDGNACFKKGSLWAMDDAAPCNTGDNGHCCRGGDYF